MADRTVLVVDDSRVARMMTRAIIARLRETWTIIEAASGEDSLEAVKAGAPDFVLMDYNMPGIDGLEAARQLRQSCPRAAITLVTANIQEPVRLHAAEIGVGFIPKPLREDDLRAFFDSRAEAP